MPCRKSMGNPRAEVLPVHARQCPQAGDQHCPPAAAHIHPCCQVAQGLSHEPWARALCSCALQAQHRHSFTGSSWSKGRPTHCSFISCAGAGPLLQLWQSYCLVARLLQETKEIPTQPKGSGWDRDTRTLCNKAHIRIVWSHGRVFFTDSTLMMPTEPVTRSNLASHSELMDRLGWALAQFCELPK